ncbi:MAG TPA: HPP family protein [Bordetella sp.]|nr:HPP family protein [Bordetella sp.]
MISAILGEVLALAFVAGTSQLAIATGVAYMLFPEMGALAYDTCKRPFGVWASTPASLFLAPTVGACIGTAISSGLPHGLPAAALCIAVSVGLLRLARSPVAPAISAAYLPLSLGVKTWHYPMSIALVTGALALLVVVRHGLSKIKTRPASKRRGRDIDDVLESVPNRFGWTFAFGTFLLLAYAMAHMSGLPFILFPPLVVIAYEMLAHSEVCPWARRPRTLPIACTLGAAIGAVSVLWWGIGPLSVVISLGAGIATLRALKLHMPPVLGISLLPQVIPHVNWEFVLAVAIGTGTLTGFFLVVRPFLLSAPPARSW